MHILITNDDGPPSNQSSPYIHSLVTTLQSAGHTVSVVLPNTQRSWIGKAHIIGQTLTASYFRPGTLHEDDGITSPHPFDDGKEEWLLIDGTPASCVQIGVWHRFHNRGPVDVVVSGPNYGRNSTALFALSSGTIGGALEAAVCGKKAIALSYAFDSRVHDPEIIAAASQISQQLIQKLTKEWPDEVQFYSVNVPLKENVAQAKILYTNILQNHWTTGSAFEEIEVDEDDIHDPVEQERKIREGDRNGAINGEKKGARAGKKQAKFKWAPTFTDVHESVQRAGPGNDGWTIKEGMISVTPLKANFWHVPNIKGEIKLSLDAPGLSLQSTIFSTEQRFYAVIDYPDSYAQPLILRALKATFPHSTIEIISSIQQLPSPNSPVLQLTAYESLDFEHAKSHPSSSLTCAYVIRKALIRKHYLSNTIANWLVKHPNSLLKTHFTPAAHFELDYAEFLDEALVDAWDLNESMAQNEVRQNDDKNKEWWILKPGMSDGGNGIRLFCSLQQLGAIFQEWDEEEDQNEDDEKDGDNLDEDSRHTKISGEGVVTSQLRHFVAQPYIDPPLLLPVLENRKFHIRAYVLAVGALKVYVYREMLALFAAKPYQSPDTLKNGATIELASHLTNTCFQDQSTRQASVLLFWDLGKDTNGLDWTEAAFEQICNISGEVFEAAAREQMVHFQILPNAFEIFGVDFLVDASHNVWLLELNAYPDFEQTGEGLQDHVVGGLFREVMKSAVRPFFGPEGPDDKQIGSDMLLARDINLGRR